MGVILAQRGHIRKYEDAMEEKFKRAADRISIIAGTPKAFLLAMLMIVLWVVSGPFMGYSDTWQLIINTGTTIVTFLMVFLIQNAQNRDAVAVQLKLDELIRAVQGARTGMINLDQLTDEQLQQLRKQFQRLGEEGGCADLTAEFHIDKDAELTVHAKYTSKDDKEEGGPPSSGQ